MSNDLKELIKNSLEKAKKSGNLKVMIRNAMKNFAENCDEEQLEDIISSGLAKSFSKLPERVEEIIEQYVGKSCNETPRWTSDAVMEGFNILSINIKEKVIKKIAGYNGSDDETAREWAAYMFIKNYDNFPTRAREEILIKFSCDESVNVKSAALMVIVMKFTGLSEKLKKLLEKFAVDKSPEMREVTAYALAGSFKKVEPYGNLLKNLAEDEESSVRRAVACAIIKNYWNVDSSVQKLLIKLAGDESVYVKKGVVNEINNNKGLPVYGKILEKLSKDARMRDYVEGIENYN